MKKQEYIDMLEDFINTKLGASIIKDEGFSEDISGDIDPLTSYKILLLEEEIVDIIINFRNIGKMKTSGKTM